MNFIRFFCLLCVFSSPNVFAAKTRDLILIAGQSNAVGYDDSADKEILFWWPLARSGNRAFSFSE